MPQDVVDLEPNLARTIYAYLDRFDAIARTLIVRQARRLFDRDTLSDEAAELLPGLILGLAAVDLDAFLEVFERLLTAFRRQHRNTSTPDFALTLTPSDDRPVPCGLL